MKFPDPRNASPEGIVAIGGDLSPETVVQAYRLGIFPWPIEDYPLLWHCPPGRAILRFDSVHISRSLARAQRRSGFRFSVDECFPEVICSCALAYRPGQDGTWITDEVIDAYIELHELGIAHSVEAWDGDMLAGGIYGVAVAGVFSAESMFYHRSDASKLCLLHLVEHLRARALTWMDVQVMTPHMQRLGAETIGRDAFLQLLRETQEQDLELF